MSKRTKNEFRHYEKLMKKMPLYGARDEVPACCKVCPYFQPHFRYRKCSFTACHYKKDVEVFRKHPLPRERYRNDKTDKLKKGFGRKGASCIV